MCRVQWVAALGFVLCSFIAWGGIQAQEARPAPQGADPKAKDTERWIGAYFVQNGLPLEKAKLCKGMKLEEFVSILGKPTSRFRRQDGREIKVEGELAGQMEYWVEWYHNPQNLHVAPFIRVKVDDDVVSQVVANRK